MWELDSKTDWVPKNRFFWTVALEQTLESPLNCKEIKPANPQGNQSWIVIGRIDAKAEAPTPWPVDAKNWFIGKDPDAGKDWMQEERGMTNFVLCKISGDSFLQRFKENMKYVVI